MPKSQTRIQRRNRAAIHDAALDVFSSRGFDGATVESIATAAGLSKPNLLYYYPNKEAIYFAVLSEILDVWLDPLHALSDSDDPLDAILAYVHRKLDISREYPRESRLFANEIVQGAPRIADVLGGDLKRLVDEKAALIERWISQGKIAAVHPYHLLFSIWSLTQHYADFDVQVRAVLANEDPFESAGGYMDQLYRCLLTP